MVQSKRSSDVTTTDQRWRQLEEQLTARSHLLVEQGSLVGKKVNGRRYTVLRYAEPQDSGRTVQRSLYVGADSGLIYRVEAWLQQLRARRQECADTLRLAQYARLLARLAPDGCDRRED